jgi:hypothetical protein
MQPPHAKSHALPVQPEQQLPVLGFVAGNRFRRFNCAQRRLPLLDTRVAAAAAYACPIRWAQGPKSYYLRLSD